MSSLLRIGIVNAVSQVFASKDDDEPMLANGLDASAIEVTSHGKADPLIHTANQTPEPRNRRVEIAVR